MLQTNKVKVKNVLPEVGVEPLILASWACREEQTKPYIKQTQQPGQCSQYSV